MIFTTIRIKKSNSVFVDVQSFLEELISDVTIQQWKAVELYLLEREYDGTIQHTYTVFDKDTSELSQVFATTDLTMFEDRVYNYSTVKNLFVAAEKKDWQIRIENS
jgi:hypothetical protein